MEPNHGFKSCKRIVTVQRKEDGFHETLNSGEDRLSTKLSSQGMSHWDRKTQPADLRPQSKLGWGFAVGDFPVMKKDNVDWMDV